VVLSPLRTIATATHPVRATATHPDTATARPDEWRDRQDQRHTFVQDNRTAAEILADLQREMAEMGLDLVPRDDSSFALPRVLPATRSARQTPGSA